MPLSSSCSMIDSASVVLPEPEPPSTAQWRFITLILSVTCLAALASSRPTRMLDPSTALTSSRSSIGVLSSLAAVANGTGDEAPVS